MHLDTKNTIYFHLVHTKINARIDKIKIGRPISRTISAVLNCKMTGRKKCGRLFVRKC